EGGEWVGGTPAGRYLRPPGPRGGSALWALTVAEVMPGWVVTCDPTEGVAELMAKMTNRRIRHLPVVRDGRLCGIVSIGDVVKNRLDEIEYEARSLRSFIAGA